MSFFNIEWLGGKAVWTYVGVQNFIELLSNKFYFPGIKNTFIFAFTAVSFQMIIGFFLALFINKIKKGRAIFIGIFIIPVLLPPIVIGSIWQLMYGYDFGIINQITGIFGILPIDWLGEKSLALPACIVVDIWHWTPFVFLLLLSGIESLPQDVFEASKMDGVSFWQEIRFITIPLMLDTIVVTMVFRMIVAFKVFDEIWLLTSGGPGTATEVLSYSIYRTFFNEDREGLGSVMALGALFIVTTMIIITTNLIKRKKLSKNA
jgi:multiple sugar transport system permease protein